jgi:hypothetical protein
MTAREEENLRSGPLYSIRQTEDRGRAVYSTQRIPPGTAVHIASEPYVSVIKEQFKKEACAWCFRYQYGRTCPIKHAEANTGVYFCSQDCLRQWAEADYDGKLAETLASLRTAKARKVVSQIVDNTDNV